MWHWNVPACLGGTFCCVIFKVIKPNWFESRVLATAEIKVPSFLPFFFFFLDIWNPLEKNNYRDIVCFLPPLPCKVHKDEVPFITQYNMGGFRTYWRPSLTYLYWLSARTMYQGGHLPYSRSVFFIRDTMHDPVTPVSQILTRTRGVNRNHRHTCRGSGKKAQQMQALN